MASVKFLLCILMLAVVTCPAQTTPLSSTPPLPSHTSPPPQATPPPQAAPPTTPTPTPPKPPDDPAITQIRKSVTFLKMRCSDAGQEFDVRGTGFFVSYPDSRLGEGSGFVYLVTNRHMAECWNDSNHPMHVESISMTMNLNNAQNGRFALEGYLNDHGNVPWVLPEDASVDLAVFPIAPDRSRFDYRTIPISLFASSDLLKDRRIVEGEPVFFAGFFSQFPGSTRMEPIVRQGIVAMMPTDKVPFVGMAERVYLADLHAFHGNSGSPAFVNLSGFHDGNISTGEDYRLLGVVNAEVTEDENFNLELTTTFKGTGKANSGISTIVPADEIKALLDDPPLQKIRDEVVKAQGSAAK